MKLGNEGIKNRFDDIDIQVDFLIELCQSLQIEKKELISRVKSLETELAEKTEIENLYEEQETMIEKKIEGLLNKLDGFSTKLSQDDLSEDQS